VLVVASGRVRARSASRPAVIRAVTGRAVQVVIVALFVTIGTDLAVRLVPGDPARTILGARASPEAVSALRYELGLDVPMAEQVTRAMDRLLHGDLGTSFAYQGQEVTSLIGPSLVVTVSLAATAIVLSLLAGVPLGLWLALVRRSGMDLAGRLVMTLLLALPSFMAGLILLYVVSLRFGLSPAGGWAGSWPANFEYVWLPALALSLYLGALIARTVRQAALDAVAQPFVEAARTRGVPRHRIVLRHVLPNSLLPVITLVGFNAGILVSGAVVTETIFSLPGLGAQLFQAMGARDLPIVQGIALVTAISIVVFNLLADLLNIAVDPRLRRTD
jgi:peptide/nickel transport system permease protein